MDCLKDYIGIAGCNSPAPLSGLYVNELPGISLKSIAGLADSETQTYLGVWEEIQKRALIRFKNDIYSFFAKQIKLKTILQSINLGSVIGSPVTAAVTGQYRGIVFDQTYGSNTITSSQYNSFYIQQLSYYSTGSIAGFQWKVIDLLRGIVLDTFTMDVVDGWNYYNVEKYYPTNKLWICYDASTVNSVSHLLPLNLYGWYGGYSYNWFGIWNTLMYGAASTTPIVNSSVQLTGYDTYGIGGIITIKCVFDALVCNNKEVFKTALWYLLGIELMKEVLYSSRITRWTTIDRGRAQELLDKEFTPLYNEAFGQTVQGFDFDTSDNCVECKTALQARFTIP